MSKEVVPILPLTDNAIEAIKIYLDGRNTTVVIADLETMSTHEDGMVLSLGTCVADLTKPLNFHDLINSKATQEYFFDPKSQQGRHVLRSTVEWWGEQGDEAKRVLRPDPNMVVPIDHCIELLKNSYRLGGIPEDKWDFTWFFTRRYMDASILRNISRSIVGVDKCDDNLPWQFWNHRDLATWSHAMSANQRGKLNIEVDGFIPHKADHDCAMDMIRLQQSFIHEYGQE